METGQSSVEMLIILAVSLIAITLIVAFASIQIGTINEYSDIEKAKKSVNDLRDAVREVYTAGSGAKKLVFIEIPHSVDPALTGIENEAIIINYAGSDIIAETGVALSGTLPAEPGGHNVWVEAREGFVFIGLGGISLDKDSVYVTMNQSGLANESITITNNSGDDVNVFVSTLWTHSEVSFDVNMTDFSIPDATIAVIDLNFSSSASATGNYSGSLEIDVSTLGGDENLSVPVNAEVLVGAEETELIVLPSSWSATILQGTSASAAFTVCNTLQTDMADVNFTPSTGDAGDWVQAVTPISPLPAESCADRNVTISVPGGTGDGTYTGTITVSDGTYSDAISLEVTVISQFTTIRWALFMCDWGSCDSTNNVTGAPDNTYDSTSANTLGGYSFDVSGLSGTIDSVALLWSHEIPPAGSSSIAETTVADFSDGIFNSTETTSLGDGEVALQSQADWWDSAWPYRVPIMISENDGAARTNQQTNLTLNLDPSKIDSCVNEIRVIDDAQTELPVRILVDNGSDPVSPSCKIQFGTTVGANSNVTYYVYYGNPSATNPSYTIPKYSLTWLDSGANAMPTTDVGADAAPFLIDFIGNDGLFDLVVGEDAGNINNVWQNTGTAQSPSWTSSNASVPGTDVGRKATPTFADLDNDGDNDLIVGEGSGVINNGGENTGSPSSPSWATNSWGLPSTDFGRQSVPRFVDIDNDNDYDIGIGLGNGTISFLRNTGSVSSPSWNQELGVMPAQDYGGRAAISFGDLDGDGDYDLIVGRRNGRLYWVLNTGGASSPSWETISLTGDYLRQSNGAIIDVGSNASPALVDLNSDGYLDLVIGASNGRIRTNSGRGRFYWNSRLSTSVGVEETNFATSGTYTSSDLDFGSIQTISQITFDANLNSQTLTIAYQLSDDAISWSSWSSEYSSSPITVGSSARYVRYRATLSGNSTATAYLKSIAVEASSGAGALNDDSVELFYTFDLVTMPIAKDYNSTNTPVDMMDTDAGSIESYDATSSRPGGGSWQWSDFSNLRIGGRYNDVGSSESEWRLDAVGVQITYSP